MNSVYYIRQDNKLFVRYSEEDEQSLWTKDKRTATFFKDFEEAAKVFGKLKRSNSNIQFVRANTGAID